MNNEYISLELDLARFSTYEKAMGVCWGEIDSFPNPLVPFWILDFGFWIFGAVNYKSPATRTFSAIHLM